MVRTCYAFASVAVTAIHLFWRWMFGPIRCSHLLEDGGSGTTLVGALRWLRLFIHHSFLYFIKPEIGTSVS